MLTVKRDRRFHPDTQFIQTCFSLTTRDNFSRVLPVGLGLHTSQRLCWKQHSMNVGVSVQVHDSNFFTVAGGTILVNVTDIYRRTFFVVQGLLEKGLTTECRRSSGQHQAILFGWVGNTILHQL
jgi:hypothetical protein